MHPDTAWGGDPSTSIPGAGLAQRVDNGAWLESALAQSPPPASLPTGHPLEGLHAPAPLHTQRLRYYLGPKSHMVPLVVAPSQTTLSSGLTSVPAGWQHMVTKAPGRPGRGRATRVFRREGAWVQEHAGGMWGAFLAARIRGRWVWKGPEEGLPAKAGGHAPGRAVAHLHLPGCATRGDVQKRKNLRWASGHSRPEGSSQHSPHTDPSSAPAAPGPRLLADRPSNQRDTQHHSPTRWQWRPHWGPSDSHTPHECSHPGQRPAPQNSGRATACPAPGPRPPVASQGGSAPDVTQVPNLSLIPRVP